MNIIMSIFRKHQCQNCGVNKISIKRKYCSYCACQKCKEQIKISKLDYCENCICKIETCCRGRMKNIFVKECDYCNKHKCIINNCLGARLELSSYCQNHVCQFLRSDRDRYYRRTPCGKRSNCKTRYCNSHVPICNVDMCKNRIDSNDTRYCSYHKCKLCRECSEKEGYKYCDIHNCKYPKCHKSKINNSEYCFRHKCSQCNKMRHTYYHYNDFYKHCIDHKCQFHLCRNPRRDDSKYCFLHTCLSCNKNMKNAGVKFCQECVVSFRTTMTKSQ